MDQCVIQMGFFCRLITFLLHNFVPLLHYIASKPLEIYSVTSLPIRNLSKSSVICFTSVWTVSSVERTTLLSNNVAKKR